MKAEEVLDKATKTLLGVGAVPHIKPKFTQKDVDRKFRTRVDRKGKGTIEEVAEPFGGLGD